MVNTFTSPGPQSSIFLFYDGPSPPPGIFDDLLAIPFIAKNVSTRSFFSLVQSFGDSGASNVRLIGTTTSVLSLTPSFLAAVVNETTYWGTKLTPKSGVGTGISVEPFSASLYLHNPDSTVYTTSTDKGIPSARDRLPMDQRNF